MQAKLKYTDLVEISTLQTLLESWHSVLGLANTVIDLDGNILAHAGWQDACLSFHRKHATSCQHCKDCDTSLANGLLQGRQFAIYNCHNGLIDTAAAIVIDGHHLANVFTGQFLSGPPDLAFFRQQAIELGYEENAYLSAIKRLPIVSPAHAQRLTGLYAQLATMLGENGLDRLRQREASHELAKLNQQLEFMVRSRTEALAAREALLAQILDTSSVSIFRLDKHGRISNANRRMEEMFCTDAANLIGRHYTELIAEADHDAASHNLIELLRGRLSDIDVERHYCRGDGSQFWGHLTGKPFYEINGKTDGLVGVIADIDARKQAEDKIRRLAYFDSLTNLPNRQHLLEKLEQTLQANTTNANYGALLFIDLDNFKTVNDTSGHDQGDRLLQQVANRLSQSLPSGCTVARLGGDEFVVMCESLAAQHSDAEELARLIGQQILDAFRQPFLLAECMSRNSASIGITLFQPGNERLEDLLKQADLAMYQAKSAGRNGLYFFNPALQTSISQKAMLEHDMHQALLNGEFRLAFQAQVDCKQAVVGIEAMVRWQHPVAGKIDPADFITQAEENGLIIALGDWILHTACLQLAQWQAHPTLGKLPLSVNVSARQFQQDNFVTRLEEILHITRADPAKLKLELTESLLLQDTSTISHKMRHLRHLGISFALDDFGTGYSSLSYLRQLPFDLLKIDRSFVRDIHHGQSELAITRMIVALADSLGLGVVAEGVENEEQRVALLACGCHVFQGYLYSKPLPAGDFVLFVQNFLTGRSENPHQPST